MKRLILLMFLITFVAGCHKLHNEVAGSGKVRTEKREIGSFTDISTEGSFNIEIVCQKPQSLEIEGDDNILPLVSTTVTNNVRHLKSTSSYSVSQPIILRISVPMLQGITSSGAGTINIAGLKNEKFEIDANGASSIRAAGETVSLSIDTKGAGKIDTFKLRAARVEVDSKGVSTVEVNAAERLDATVSGPSHVIYRGNAVVNKTIHGPGSVEKKEAE